MEQDKPLTVMVECPKCNVPIAEHNLKRHLKNTHSEEREINTIGQKNLQALHAAQEAYLNTKVYCSTCRTQIKLKEIKRHFAATHGSAVTKDMLALVGLSEPKNMFKSTREREAYWKVQAGIPTTNSEDLFDRTKVLNGGAFGLGRSRKN